MNIDHSAPTVLLTLVMPMEVDDALTETLLEHPDLAPGFTSQRVEGQGRRVQFIGTAEHVRGRAAYTRIELVLARDDADALLNILRREFSTSRVFFWLTPVLASGRLA